MTDSNEQKHKVNLLRKYQSNADKHDYMEK